MSADGGTFGGPTIDDAKLVAQGYEPVALVGKQALGPGWTSRPNTVAALAAERAALGPSACNTGLRTGRLCVWDVDLLAPEHAAAVKEAIFAAAGPTMMERVGSKGMALCYRNETPITKLTITGEHKSLKHPTKKLALRVEGTGGQIEVPAPLPFKVEVLGVGQQLACYGIHPETGRPFTWTTAEFGNEPLQMPLCDVPAITPQTIHDTAERVKAAGEALGYANIVVSAHTDAEAKPGASSAGGKRLSWSGLRTRLSWIHPRFDGVRPACYPPPSRKRKTKPLPYGGDAWVKIALCLRDGVVPLLDNEPHDWLALIEEWSSGVLWFERTNERIDVADRIPLQGIPNRLKGEPRRDGGRRVNVGTIIDYALDAGCPLPPDDEPLSETFKGLRIPDAASSGSEPSPFRQIKIVGGDRPNIVKEAEAALIEQSVGVFQRGSLIVRPAEIAVETRGGKKVGDLLLVPLTVPALCEHMTSAATFLRWNVRDGSWKPIDCPREIAETFLARGGDWNLRVLSGIINAPTLRPDGSLLDQPGYDPQTGLLYDPRGVAFPPILAEPSRDDAFRAVALFDELIGEFPFASPEARAVALAGFLTICIRRTLPVAPIFGFDGTGPGTGKSLIADTIAAVGGGRAASPITTGSSEEELEKRVAAMLMRGDLTICIDNVSEKTPLDSTFLCSATSQQTVSVRVLGQSRNLLLPTNAFFEATGNGLTFGGDLWRRGLSCLIDPQMERPSERKFAFNPVQRVMQDRGKYVAAALTVLRAYQSAGAPSQSGRTMGGFEPWTRTVRDPLLWVGQADPVATCAPPADDPERERFAAVIAAWRDVIGEGKGVSARQAIDLAIQAMSETPCRRELSDAFQAVAAPMVRAGGSLLDPRRLGEWLRSKKRMVVNGYRLMPVGESSAGVRWSLERVKGHAS
jgi:hypothetical protein